MSYIDYFANRSERAYKKLTPEAPIHLARSCFASLLQQAHQDALAIGDSHELFRDQAIEAIKDLRIPVFTDVDPRMHLPGKRQPSLVESLEATVERYKAIDQLSGIFSNSADSMIYGGSMKYGPFLNVRSGADGSDIDAIVFTDEGRLDETDWRGVMETDLFDERDKITFFARTVLQRSLYDDGLIDITSQRFTISNKGYTMSTHFMPVNYMKAAYPIADPERQGASHHRYVRDYKERPFERTHVTNYSMSRTEHDIPVYSNPTQGGFIASNPAYSVIQSRYIPGMYQNLVLPDAKFVLGSNSKSAEHLRNFSAYITQREIVEKQLDPQSSVRNTEPRLPILAANVSDILSS